MQFIPPKLKANIPLTNMATIDRQVLFICIGLAFVFWIILNLSQDYEITKEIIINYDVGPERVVAGNPPRSIPVQIRGRGWDLIWEGLRGGSGLEVTISLDGATELVLGSNFLRQEIRRQLSSGSLEVENMGYESQPILTTPLDGKRVPVVSGVTTTFGSGYFAPEGVVFTPDSITISGSADELEDIDSWPTKKLVLKKLVESVTATVDLQPPPPGLTINYTSINLAVVVDAFIEQQLQVPVVMRHANSNDSSRVFPAFVTVTATIPQRDYGTYKVSDFRVEADLTRMQTVGDHNTLPLQLERFPPSIRSVSFTPQAVEYYLYRRDDQ